MNLRKFLLCSPFTAAALWAAYGFLLSQQIPRVEIRETSPLPAQHEKALPFFELMSPLPSLEQTQALPKLEYKKGPPERFLERITVLFQASAMAPKERAVYFGRQSRGGLYGLSLFPEDAAREARYVEAAIRTSQGEPSPYLSGWKAFVFRPFFLREALKQLSGVSVVTIMDQAGTPAFYFEHPTEESGRARASALFVRRNSFYRVSYTGDKGFSALDPFTIFRKSFLTERRADALEYVARNLTGVHLEKESGQSLQELSWPIMLLAAYASVDPSSIDTFFHFAGLNALLYRSTASTNNDLEISDTLRNNVLASDAYARDIAPDTGKTAEIGRFARLLTRNFDQ